MTNRRSFLVGAGTIGTLPLAGCISDSDVLSDEGNETDSGEENETDDNPESEDPDEDGEETETDEETDTDEDPDGDGEDDEGDEDEEREEDEGEDESENDGGDELADLPGETIDDFEDTDAWSPIIGQEEITPDDEDVYAGSSSAQITAPEEEDDAMVYRGFSDGLDLSDHGISLAIKYTGREQFDLTVQLLATSVRDRVDFRRVLTGAEDRWQRVDLGVDSIQGDPDLTNVNEIRIIGRRRGNEDGEINFVVDDLRAAETPGTGAVMLLFDGTLDSHYTTALEHLEEFGFRGVEAVMPEALGNDGRLTIDELTEMSEAGWDMISRPRTGAQFLDEYTPEQQEGLIRRTQGFLNNRGFEDGARHFLTPRNIMSPDSHDLVREYHEQAFRFGGNPNALPTTDPHNLGHFSGTGGSNTERFVELAAAYNQLAVLHFTGIGDEDEIGEDEFESLLEFIDELDIQVVTASDLLDSDLGELTEDGADEGDGNETDGNETEENGGNESEDSDGNESNDESDGDS